MDPPEREVHPQHDDGGVDDHRSEKADHPGHDPQNGPVREAVQVRQATGDESEGDVPAADGQYEIHPRREPTERTVTAVFVGVERFVVQIVLREEFAELPEKHHELEQHRDEEHLEQDGDAVGNTPQ